MNLSFERIQSTGQYRGFNLYGGCERISETLLGRSLNEANRFHRFQAHERSYHRADPVSFSDDL